MTTWLKGYEPVRSHPRLWVETMWLIESREPLVTTRTIRLHPGLNIVWAKESASRETPGLASAGHGVGKTSLCLLLRYSLGDDASAIATLREKVAANFPKGGVAAKVHLNGVAWIVFRPYGAHSHSLAAQCDELEPLLKGEIPNNYSGYSDALELLSVGRLAVQSLPGTDQPLKWRHLLAWCIREQRTRFDGFYHWRDGEGLGFKRSRQDPPLFVSLVLGLVDAALDQLLREIETKQAQLDRGREKLPELERAPTYALAHADRQLRLRVRAEEDEPVFMTTAGESVESRVLAVLSAAEKEEGRWEGEADKADEQLAMEQVRLLQLNKQLEMAELEMGIAKSLVDANRSDFERLAKQRELLEALQGRCDHGAVEFKDCLHIQERKSAVNMTWFRDGKEVQANEPELVRRYATRKEEFDKAGRAVSDQSRRVSSGKADLRRLRIRLATSESARGVIKEAWDELQLRHMQREKGSDSAELIQARKRLEELEAELSGVRASVASRRTQQSARVDAIKSLTSAVSTRLLGASGHARFVSGDEFRPFEVSRGGEAYQVLEVLLGDIVCLLDSVVSDESCHPGFLVHDCPREADMSERLYREFFLTASEAAAQFGLAGVTPFQFVVTTTSPPPEQLTGERYVVLELEPGDEEKLLFKRQLAPELPGLESL